MTYVAVPSEGNQMSGSVCKIRLIIYCDTLTAVRSLNVLRTFAQS